MKQGSTGSRIVLAGWMIRHIGGNRGKAEVAGRRGSGGLLGAVSAIAGD
jgi:hypothetical protein